MQAFIIKSSGIKLNPLGFGQEFGHITAFHILLGQLCWVRIIFYLKGGQVQTDNKFFDDLAKLGQSAVGTLHGVKGEIESAIHARLEQVLMTMDIVSREEYDVVLDMAKEARAKNLELEQKITALEKKLNAVKTSKNKTSKEVKK